MPPPKSAEAPLQGLEGLVAEFFAGSGVLCRGASAVLFVDGIRGHVAHRFHGWRATAATLLPSGCIVRKYFNLLFLFLLSRDRDASARTRTTRNTRRTQFRSDRMLSRDGIAGKSRYIVRLPVVVRGGGGGAGESVVRWWYREAGVDWRKSEATERLDLSGFCGGCSNRESSYPTRWMSSIEVTTATTGAADRERL